MSASFYILLNVSTGLNQVLHSYSPGHCGKYRLHCVYVKKKIIYLTKIIVIFRSNHIFYSEMIILIITCI